MRLTAIVAAGLAGCAWGGGTDSHGILGTDARPPVDARPGDGGGDAQAPTEHVLLSEIALAGVGAEFLEVTNPTTQAFALDQVYLSDAGDYWKQPVGGISLNAADFIVKFPAAASLAPGATITIAIGGATAFMAIYGVAPTYSIADGTMTAVNVGMTPSLTDAGEVVALFQWNGTDELVKDVDLMVAGVPSNINQFVSKSGVMQGASTYKTDANTIAAQPAAPIAGQSTKRIAAEGMLEMHGGTGNGITGHDETSENTAMTWDTTFTAPTPGQVPAF